MLAEFLLREILFISLVDETDMVMLFLMSRPLLLVCDPCLA